MKDSSPRHGSKHVVELAGDAFDGIRMRNLGDGHTDPFNQGGDYSAAALAWWPMSSMVSLTEVGVAISVAKDVASLVQLIAIARSLNPLAVAVSVGEPAAFEGGDLDVVTPTVNCLLKESGVGHLGHTRCE